MYKGNSKRGAVVKREAKERDLFGLKVTFMLRLLQSSFLQSCLKDTPISSSCCLSTILFKTSQWLLISWWYLLNSLLITIAVMLVLMNNTTTTQKIQNSILNLKYLPKHWMMKLLFAIWTSKVNHNTSLGHFIQKLCAYDNPNRTRVHNGYNGGYFVNLSI